MLRLHAVLAVDRAGLVGEDGETHHGVFDVGFLGQVPGLKLLCPGSCLELSQMLRWAVKDQSGPVAIRYPRGGDRGYTDSAWDGKNQLACHRTGDAVTVITYGTLLENVLQAADLLAQKGIQVTVLRAMQLSDLEEVQLRKWLAPGKKVFVAEEVCAGSGIRGQIASLLPDYAVTGADLGRNFVTHGDLKSLYSHYGLDATALAEKIAEVVNRES